MPASRPARRSRPALRSALGAEQLESRTLLAVAAGDVPPQLILPADVCPPATDAGVAGPDIASLVVQSAVLTAAPDPTPWFTYAQQSAIGSSVLRIVLTPGGSPGDEPTTSAQVLQTTFNAAKQAVISPPANEGGTGSTTTATDPKITGVVFPGPGVPVLPTDTWPKSIDELEGQKPPEGSGPQEYFVVLQSDSDLMLGLTSFMVTLLSDPKYAQGGGFSEGGSATETPDPGSPFGSLGGQGGDDPAGMAALMAFALLAGLGEPSTGPAVALVNDTGVSDTDRITSDGRLDVTADPGARLQYSVDGGNRWRNYFRAREGDNTVQVRQIDAAGTPSVATSFTFTLDRQRPPTPRVSLGGGAAGVQPALASDVPSFVVKKQESGAELQYSVNRGDWNSSLSSATGRNVVRVRQVDPAGNASRPSRAIVFTVPGQSPAADILRAAAFASTTAGDQKPGRHRR